jgi:hypothetical protein
METDSDKALTLLVHDLRAPLSVAQGYLRLIKENRLPSPAERDRALAQTMDALGRIAKLCQDASAFSAGPESDGVATVTEPARTFAERVQRTCSARGADTLDFNLEDRALTGVVRAHRIDRLAEAVATVLCAAHRAPRDQPARVGVAGGQDEVQFLFGADEDRSALATASSASFDPWRGGHGLALPLACRTIGQAGGRIWSATAVPGAVAVALPQE